MEDDLDCEVEENVFRYAPSHEKQTKKNPLLRSKGSHVDEHNLE